MAFKPQAEGVLAADGSEQIVAELTEAARLSGYISLSNMEAGDTVTLRQYVRLSDTWGKHAEENYSGPQNLPIIYFTSKEIASGLKVTLQQTAGLRTFPYKFVKEVVELMAHFSV